MTDIDHIDEPPLSWSAEHAGVLFSGDAGGLTFEQRECLVKLLKHRYISRYTHPGQWPVLIEQTAVIESRLNDLFLTLHVDREREVAYKRQAIPDDEGTSFPTLLHDTPYSRDQTVALVVLRERLQQDRAAGIDTVTIDHEDLRDEIAEFRTPDMTNVVEENKRADRTIASLVKMKILDERSDGRYAITPVLDALLPLERLRELLEWLRSQQGTALADEHNETDIDSQQHGDHTEATAP